MSTIPERPIYIYRMIHFDNIKYVLQKGMCCKDHPDADPNYINIGNMQLIEDRKTYPIRLPLSEDVLGDYVPFYFAGHSPMLLNIKTGHNVLMIPQEDIIFVCCDLDDVITICKTWVFTDGHAKDKMTSFYNDLKDLSHIDWNAVNATYWRNTEDDFDKQRKKQAEFLVKSYIPVCCIKEIFVKTIDKKIQVENIVRNIGLNIPVNVDQENKLYYS